MGKEKEIDLYSSDVSELNFTDESEDTIKKVLDERDYILPLKDDREASLDPLDKDDSMATKEQIEQEIPIRDTDNDNQAENTPDGLEAKIPLDEDDDNKSDEPDLTEDGSDPIADPGEDDPVPDGSVGVEDVPAVEDPVNPDETPAEVAENGDTPDAQAQPGSNDSGPNDQPEKNLRDEPSERGSSDDFVGLDDAEIEEKFLPKKKVESKKAKDIDKLESEPANKTVEKNKDRQLPQVKESRKPAAPKAAKESEASKGFGKLSWASKIINVALMALIAAGFYLYYNPSLVGLTKAEQPVLPAPVEVIEPVTPVAQPVTTPSVASKRDQCIAKLEEAVRLRKELLEKKDEIYELDLYYRNGIAELEDEIYQEIQKSGISSYKEAVNNKRIELNMRTIQRRQAYIKELTKPAYWLKSGSEELFFLVRKGQLDLELTEIAGGIDLNKHVRHISAAIQKYRPSPENLAVDPLQSKVQPLEKIWEQISQKKNTKDKAQIALNPKNEIIETQICSGNLARIAELTSISPAAAGCLSRMSGADLFLNGLTTLSPDAAKQLFKWQGNWICLNGVKDLSPAAAKFLFKWKGSWISLNSLDELPPELAMYLLKWEGQQLELMGLKYNKNEATQKTLKYLALWETTGGKLYVTDEIRKEMERLM